MGLNLEQGLGQRLFELESRQSVWSQRTFGLDSKRGPLGPLRHLEEEAREAQDEAVMVAETAGGCGSAAAKSNLRIELADCFLLLLDATRRSGLTVWDLVEEARKKQAVNEQRQWPTPTDDEPVRHLEETV